MSDTVDRSAAWQASRNASIGNRTPALAEIVRWTAIAGVFTAALAGVGLGMSTIVALVAMLAAMDTRRSVALINIALGYNFLVFIIGPTVVDVSDPGRVQAFGASLAVVSLLAALAGRVGSKTVWRVVMDAAEPSARGLARSVQLLWLTFWVSCVLILLQIVRLGPGRYFSGSALAAAIRTYAQGGLSLSNIASLAVGVVGVVVIAVHVSIAMGAPGQRLAWRPMLLVGVFVPILGLERGQIMSSAITLLLVYALGRGGSVKRHSTAVQVVVALVTFGLVFALGVGIGNIREQAITGSPAQRGTILKSEFTPVIVADAALSSTASPRYDGNAILIPAIARFVPRRYFPGKPDNTTARFMRAYDPESFQAGFSLAPTAIGVLLLNFGIVPTLALWFVLAFATVRYVDRRKTVNGMAAGAVVVIYANMYSLLRNDLANSIPLLAVSLLCYAVVRYHLVGRQRA